MVICAAMMCLIIGGVVLYASKTRAQSGSGAMGGGEWDGSEESLL